MAPGSPTTGSVRSTTSSSVTRPERTSPSRKLTNRTARKLGDVEP